MALVKCTECGQPVSTRARACPHCGAPRPGALRRAALLAAITALVLGGTVALTIGGADAGPATLQWPTITAVAVVLLAVVLAVLTRRS